MDAEPHPPDTAPSTVPKRYTVRKTGRNVATERKATIYTLADTLKLKPTAIANRLHMDRRTVRAILETRDHDAVMARNILDANAVKAAVAWVKSIQVGATKGRHEPARDLLLHRRVIEPVLTTSLSASVNVVLSGGDLPQELHVSAAVPTALPTHDLEE